MKNKILILIVTLIGSSTLLFAQPKTLNKGEFFQPIWSADEVRAITSRREKLTYKFYVGNDLQSTRILINEYVYPEKERHISTLETEGKIERKEIIRIDKNIYQKIDNGNWTKETEMQPFGFDSFMPLPVSQEYSVENITIDTKPLKLYIWSSVTYSGNEKTEENKIFHENKYWIDAQGFKIKAEFKTGRSKTQSLISHSLEEYEYEPKDLKITAPKLRKK